MEPRHSGAEFLHPSGDFVPESEWRRLVLPVASLARYDREVGMAQAGAGNSDHHLARSRVRVGYLLKLWLRLCLQKSVCEHHYPPVETLIKGGQKSYLH